MQFEIWLKMKISPDFENFDMQKCQSVSSSNSHRDFYYSSLDSLWQDAFNSGQFMSLASLDRMLFTFYCFEFFENNVLSIDARDIKRLPFDASHQGEFNELHFVIFWSWIGEIMQFENLAKNENFFWFQKFWHAKMSRRFAIYQL